MTTLKQNIKANYIGQIYAALVGLFSAPFYVNHLGVEAFGLIGLYVALQAWFQMLDIGLSDLPGFIEPFISLEL